MSSTNLPNARDRLHEELSAKRHYEPTNCEPCVAGEHDECEGGGCHCQHANTRTLAGRRRSPNDNTRVVYPPPDARNPGTSIDEMVTQLDELMGP